jgi:hypothetical protein
VRKDWSLDQVLNVWWIGAARSRIETRVNVVVGSALRENKRKGKFS